ncbi:MAG TPA: undecaprenyl/decaprenyl-phosphate alpha-N-acetylglucosaminyl 1-phosphate transferase [Firmicutes bacterium]|nr:undecaprenyl/decaprenyl-phosphate alpha-N-acetylglucosaminyl 1-phosphate transferase [Bacillota bacterium]
MNIDTSLLVRLLLALGAAFVISFASTPAVKAFAQKVGAIDVPNEARRVHDHPIPRLGGLAIFIGFLLSVILFADINTQIRGILIGSVVIAATGAIDDIISLRALTKLLMQIIAAVIAVLHGVVIEVVMNPNVFAEAEHISLGILSVPITILWIVAVTNAVNLIDGLDGLAVGVSTIASVTMLVVALVVSEPNVAIILACLAGACVGFMPYNLNPAKIFMGDTGALLLGYVLSTMSVVGMFKFYAVVSFFVPVLALAVPLIDTSFAFIRRILRGQSPFTPDRGHFHHRLLDMGMSQKQAVSILYTVSIILGVSAVVLATTGEFKILILVVGFCIAAACGLHIAEKNHNHHEAAQPHTEHDDGKN